MKIFITGGTGFVGRALIRRLLVDRPDTHIRVLARTVASFEKLGLAEVNLEPVYGDIFDPDVLAEGMDGCQGVIHLVGIIRETDGNTFERVHYEGSRNVIDAATKTGVLRFLHMSAENTRADAPDRYHTTKYQAEEYLKASSLQWTIIRPSMLFGREDQNFNELARIIRMAPCIPVVGDGEYVWQPVWVEDVAELFVRALAEDRAVGKTYEIRGPEAFTFNQVLDLLMNVMGRSKPKLHVPVSVMQPVVSLMGLLPSLAPLTPDQMKMLLDRTAPPPENFSSDFPLHLKRLEDGLKEYI